MSLNASCGYADLATVRSVKVLQDLLDLSTAPEHRRRDTYAETFTFLEPDAPLPCSLPWTSERGNLVLVEQRSGIVLGVSHRPTPSIVGSSTAVIEKGLPGTRATTRTRGTIERLLQAASPW